VTELDEVVLRADPANLLLRRGPHLHDHAHRLLAYPLAEVLHHVEADVRLQQRRAHVLERLVDGGLVQLGHPLELLLGGAETFGQRLEHWRAI